MASLAMTVGEFDPYAEYPLVRTPSSHSSSSSRGREPADSSTSHEEAEQLIFGAADGAATVRSRRFNFAILLPALMTSVMAAGVASALLGWLVSRRVYSTDNSAFHHALVAAESRANDGAGIQLISHLFGADQGDNSVDGAGTTMYGLALSSVAVCYTTRPIYHSQLVR